MQEKDTGLQEMKTLKQREERLRRNYDIIRDYNRL